MIVRAVFGLSGELEPRPVLDGEWFTAAISGQDADYGRFAWIYDPDGNKIELWQPLTPKKK